MEICVVYGLPPRETLARILTQVAGGIAGTMIALVRCIHLSRHGRGNRPLLDQYVLGHSFHRGRTSRARRTDRSARHLAARAAPRKGTPYAELGLADPKWSDDKLIDFMIAHPILIQRPIVVTSKAVTRAKG